MKKIITLLTIVFYLHANAQIITTVAGNGLCPIMPCYSGDGGQATDAGLHYPTGVALDASGNFYIADYNNGVIRKVNTTGIITTIAGTGSCCNHLGDGGQSTAAELLKPIAVTFDAAGNLYIADIGYSMQRVRKVNTAGIITTIAGNGTMGYSGDGGYATDAQLNDAHGIAVDNAGNLYIADGANSVIRKVNTAGIITTVVGNGIAGNSGDGGQATAAELYTPWGIVFDAVGNLYFGDYNDNIIRKVNTLGIITTIAGTYITIGGYSGDGGAATAAKLNEPVGLVFDAAGNLYIGDEGNNRIRIVNNLGIINTFAGNGFGASTSGGGAGDGGAAIAAELWNPYSITFDAHGNLYIADSQNNKIRKIVPFCSDCAGIEHLANNNEQINIYPNPTPTDFVIETNSTNKQTLQVFDVNGKLVLTQTINGKANIDASNLAEGVYNLNLQSPNGVVNKRLVIVR